MRGRLGSRRFGRGGGDVVDVAEPSPVVRPRSARPCEPVYPRSYDVGCGEDASVERSLARVVRCKLRDGRYHPAHEIMAVCRSVAVCVAVLGEIASDGYELVRVGDSIKITPRLRGARLQSVAQVLRGVRWHEESKVVDVTADVDDGDDVDTGFDASEEVATDAEVAPSEGGDVLVLSDPPGDLSLPLRGAMARTRVVIGQRGSGKTYHALVLVEEMLSRSDPCGVIVVDPNGVCWGLLATADGRPSDLPVLLFGGQRGQLLLGPADGAAVVDVARSTKKAVVLDLSQMGRSDQMGFVAAMCGRVMSADPWPVHLVVDEADRFAPQRFGALPAAQRLSLDGITEVFLRGRSRGVGGTLVTLRPAVLNTTVRSQSEALCIHRLMDPRDVKAVSDWLDGVDHGVVAMHREECLGQLPVLPTGTAYYLQGGDFPMFRRFKTRRRRTYDSSRTLDSEVRALPTLARPSSQVMEQVAQVMGRRVGG